MTEPHEPDTLEGVTALVIDDSPDNRFFLRRWLTSAGASVQEAATGTEGLALADDQPDLIVCDVQLPDINGLEVTARIKSDPILRRIPLIQRSSVAIDRREQADGLSSGADAYLVEPIDRNLLVATALSLMRFRRVSDALEAALSVDVTGVFDWSIETGTVRWSESLEVIHGLPAGGFGGHFDDFLASVHADDRDRVVDDLQQQLAEAETVELAYRFLRSDGRHGWIESRGSTFRDAEGRPVRLLGLAHDVTDREVERARLEQLSRLAFDLNERRTVNGVLDVVRAELATSGATASWDPISTEREPASASYTGTSGVLRLVSRPDEQQMSPRQLAAVAQLVGGALERAELFEREQTNAIALQTALLPPAVPQVPGWQLDATYLPPTSGDRLGGDFYDIVELEDSFVVILGDVAGHGLDATRQMGTVRIMLRTLAVSHEGRPHVVLERANDLFSGICGRNAPFVTVIVMRIGHDGRVAVARAGHPPPITYRLREAGLLEVAACPPLGIVQHCSPVATTFVLEPGDWIAGYTDGVFEVRDEPLLDSLERLAPLAPEAPTAGELIVLGEDGRELNDDDRAVVVVRRLAAGNS